MAHEERIKNLEVEASYVDDLKGKVIALSQQENKSAGDKALLNSYVQGLNESVDGLNLSYDAQNDKLLLNGAEMQNIAKEIGSVTEAYIKQAEAQVHQERILELVRERVTEEEKLADAVLKKQEAEEAWAAKEQEIMDIRLSGVGSFVDIKSQEADAVTAARNAVEEAEAGLKTATDAENAYTTSVEKTTVAQEKATTASLDNAKINQEVADIYGNLAESTQEKITLHLAVAEMSMADFQKSIADNVDLITNDFEQIPDKFKLSLDELMEIQKINTAIYQAWQENMVLLTGKLSDEALIELAKLGPGANSVLEELVAGGEEKWEEYNNIFDEKSRLSVDSAVANIDNGEIPRAVESTLDEALILADGKLSEFSRIGMDIAAGIAAGIMGNLGAMTGAMGNVVDGTLRAARYAADSHSPARKFIPLGEDMDAGIAVGLEKAHFSQEAASELINKAREAAWAQQATLGVQLGSAVQYNSSNNSSSSDMVIEKIEVHTGGINSELDIEQVCREIGERAAHQIRLKGGIG